MMEKEFNFWQDHSLQFLEMAFQKEKEGVLARPDGYGKRTGDCGDTIELFLSVNKNIIEEISYRIQGCINTNACTNALIQMAENTHVDQAWAITPEMIAEYLKTLPEDHQHCAELAVGSLYQALADYHKKTVEI